MSHQHLGGGRMAKERTIRICLAASAGGHLVQLLKLADTWKPYSSFCITTAQSVSRKLEKFTQKVYVVGESNRRYPWQALKVFLRCTQILIKEKPDVVLSTGAAAGCIACFIGKLLGARVVWVDSITNTERISLSGRMVRFIADLFLVQWPELAQQYKNVEYIGTLV